ncbi:Hsp20/alpha crystallin family protein [Burkholderia multivorans]|uniref:Hsp20/alpha crystallin family protein n=1 Tax=Burkholderia multivorans TaxID=87883 RepID=UPI001C27B0B3|nr:Hsp20/alpha crystallin family protein [Burkholderia multivorans]MBU9374829.1 Hsp20/alpha crystallin family protein [Burkholderia multivorans]MDN7606180.1 Hsp20/alpha crystallin family protein [Burkholderia multivorans]
MDFRNLIPWNRDRNVPAVRQREDDHPVLALHREMNRLFDDFFRSFDMPARFGSSLASSFGWPNIELNESDDAITVVAELPGLEQKDIDVSLDHDVLTIRGEKKGGSTGAVYSERWQGAFQRSVQLSPDADPEKVAASFRNGVLTVTIAKRPDAQSRVRRIPVNG